MVQSFSVPTLLPGDVVQAVATMRESLGVSSTDVAKRRGVTPSTHHQWERGADSRLSTLLEVTNALDAQVLVTLIGPDGSKVRIRPAGPDVDPLDLPSEDQAQSLVDAMAATAPSPLTDIQRRLLLALTRYAVERSPDPDTDWGREDDKFAAHIDEPVVTVTRGPVAPIRRVDDIASTARLAAALTAAIRLAHTVELPGFDDIKDLEAAVVAEFGETWYRTLTDSDIALASSHFTRLDTPPVLVRSVFAMAVWA